MGYPQHPAYPRKLSQALAQDEESRRKALSATRRLRSEIDAPDRAEAAGCVLPPKIPRSPGFSPLSRPRPATASTPYSTCLKPRKRRDRDADETLSGTPASCFEILGNLNLPYTVPPGTNRNSPQRERLPKTPAVLAVARLSGSLLYRERLLWSNLALEAVKVIPESCSKPGAICFALTSKRARASRLAQDGLCGGRWKWFSATGRLDQCGLDEAHSHRRCRHWSRTTSGTADLPYKSGQLHTPCLIGHHFAQKSIARG